MLVFLLKSAYGADLEREKPVKNSKGKGKKQETLGESQGKNQEAQGWCGRRIGEATKIL